MKEMPKCTYNAHFTAAQVAQEKITLNLCSVLNISKYYFLWGVGRLIQLKCA